MAKRVPMDYEAASSYHVTQWELKSQLPIYLKGFYLILHEWVIEHEYQNAESAIDFVFPELSYYESRRQDKGREIWFKWRLRYAPQGSPFYRRALNFDVHALGFKPVDIVDQGTKYSFEKGELWFACRAELQIDYHGKWKKHPFLKRMLDVFWKRVFWKDLQLHQKEVYNDAFDLYKLIKEYMEIRLELPGSTKFWPTRDQGGELESPP